MAGEANAHPSIVGRFVDMPLAATEGLLPSWQRDACRIQKLKTRPTSGASKHKNEVLILSRI